MTDGSSKFFCPRLVDYVAIVGARHASSECNVQLPELLRRYPPDDHKDFPLPPDVVFFCQPEGCILSGTRKSSLRETNTFVISLTDKDTSRVRYGIVVNFYRTIERKSLGSRRSSERSTPAPPESVSPQPTLGDAIPVRRHQRTNSLTSLCLISHHPFFTAFREFLFVLKKIIDVTSQKYLIHKSPTSKSSRK